MGRVQSEFKGSSLSAYKALDALWPQLVPMVRTNSTLIWADLSAALPLQRPNKVFRSSLGRDPPLQLLVVDTLQEAGETGTGAKSQSDQVVPTQ